MAFQLKKKRITVVHVFYQIADVVFSFKNQVDRKWKLIFCMTKKNQDLTVLATNWGDKIGLCILFGIYRVFIDIYLKNLHLN